MNAAREERTDLRVSVGVVVVGGIGGRGFGDQDDRDRGRIYIEVGDPIRPVVAVCARKPTHCTH